MKNWIIAFASGILCQMKYGWGDFVTVLVVLLFAWLLWLYDEEKKDEAHSDGVR